MKKKFICIVFLVLLLFANTSCSNIIKDPIDLAMHLDKNDYEVEVLVDDERIKSFSDEFETRSSGIYCIVLGVPDNGFDYEKMGIFVYCQNTYKAEKIETDLNKYTNENDEFREEMKRCIVERIDEIVFVGCVDAWEYAQNDI